MKKLLTLFGAAATTVAGVIALAVPMASAEPANKLLGAADCDGDGVPEYSTFIANSVPLLNPDVEVGATAVNLEGPGAGVAFGGGEFTYRGNKDYWERGVYKNLTSCDVTVSLPDGTPIAFYPGTEIRLSGVLDYPG